jgi:hypothetical protein
VSQLSARSEKPAGLNSGKAISTYNDIESERFVLLGQSLEEMYVDLFSLTIDAAKVVNAKNPEFSVMSFTKNGAMETLKWMEIDLDNSKYVLKPYPTSALPNTPEGRFATLQEWQNVGLISQDEFAELMDLPQDIISMMRRKNAGRYMVKDALAKMVETGEVVRANKYWPIDLAVKLTLEEISYLTINNCPQDTLETLYTFLDDLMALQEQMQPPPPPPQPTPTPALPPGMPPM